MHEGHPFIPSELTSQPLVPAEQLHAVWPLNAVSQHSGDGGDRRTNLHFAVIRQDEQTVRRLLFDRFSVEDNDNTGNQPLHYAVKGRSENIVNLLIRFGADVNAKGQLGQTPLHLAAFKLNFTRYLLTAGANTEVQDENGDTPVHLAVLSLNQEDGPRVLHSSVLYAMVDKKCDLNIGNFGGMTPFHGLITQDPNKQVISAAQIHCLQNGASSTLPHPDRRTPLEIVLWHHQQYRLSHQNRFYEKLCPFSTIIKVLIDKGADPQTKLSSGATLISACIEAAGENVFSKNVQDMCKALCERADIVQDRIPGKHCGVSLLHMLARCCLRTEKYWGLDITHLFTTVLARGADPNFQDKEGRTPLHMLFRTRRNNPTTVFKVMELMIEHGGKPLMPDLLGGNPVFAAAEFFANSRSKQCVQPLRLLLKSTLRFPTVALPLVEPDGLQGECGWEDWRLAVSATEWSQALEIIRDSQIPCSKALVKAVKEGAVGALAEWHMKAWDGNLESPDRVQQRRRHVARIIHDCQSMDVPVNMQYYQELVELSL